jgi:hypothetical protein
LFRFFHLFIILLVSFRFCCVSFRFVWFRFRFILFRFCCVSFSFVSFRFVSACFVSFRFCFVSCFIITPFPLFIKNIFVCLFLDENVLSYVLVAYWHGILNNILRNHVRLFWIFIFRLYSVLITYEYMRFSYYHVL